MLTPFTRRLAAPALMATAAFGFMRPALRPAVCDAPRFFGSQQGGDDDPETARLRRENADLKRRLGDRRADDDAPDSGGLLGGLKSLFGGREETALEKQQRKVGAEIDEAFKGGGLVGSMMGALAKGVVGMAGKAFAETRQDMDATLRAVERALADRFGADVACDPPMQQAYSSSSINGRVTKQIQLVCRARGSKGGGVVRAAVSVDGNGTVDIQSLDVDGSAVSPGPRGGGVADKGRGVIIDV